MMFVIDIEAFLVLLPVSNQSDASEGVTATGNGSPLLGFLGCFASASPCLLDY